MKCKAWSITLALLLLLLLTVTTLFSYSFLGEPHEVGARAFGASQGKCRFGDSVLAVDSTGMDGCTFCHCEAPNRLECHGVPGCIFPMEKVQVVTTATEQTLGGTIALVNSIWANTNSTVLYHVIVGDQPTYEHLRNWLARSALNSVSVNIVELPHGILPPSANPLVNYARHYLPQLFPNVVGRMLYIEPYSIVQGDIIDLWKTPINSGDLVAASTNCQTMGKHFYLFEGKLSNYMNFGRPIIKKAQLSPSECAFDDGVFVLELHAWRYNNISAQLKAWTRMDEKYKIFAHVSPGEEQLPPFLAVLHNRHTEIDPLWNVRSLGHPMSKRYSTAFLETAHLLQWSGPTRPWEGRAEHTAFWDKYYIPNPTSHFHVVRKTNQ